MTITRIAFIAVLLIVGPQLVSAQDVSRYRDYALESSVEEVVAASGARPADAKTLHERPAKIQELEWRAPYVSSEGELADPVQGAIFSFYDDALYQVVVSYDPDRTEGLTHSDMIGRLTAVYGPPSLRSAGSRPTAPLVDAVVLAQWESQDSSLTLIRGAYAAEFKLVLLSKALSAKARIAIREAGRLDAIEAPQLELQQRKKELADAEADRDRVRTTNKAAFRP